MPRWLLPILALIASLALCAGPALAASATAPKPHPTHVAVGVGTNDMWAEVDGATKGTGEGSQDGGGAHAEPVTASSSTSKPLPPGEWKSEPVCAIGGNATCGELAYCPDGTVQQAVWYETKTGTKINQYTACASEPLPTTPTNALPALDPYAELQTVVLPESTLHFQPAGNQTLVHFKSNFYTDSAPFDATVTLAGGATKVDFKIRPVEFDWTFGDGTTLKTTSPGAPYPKLDVTHEYLKSGTVTASVSTVWGAEYRVNGGAWGPVNGTVTKTGAGVAITVRQATPVLTD